MTNQNKKSTIYCITTSETDPKALYKIGRTSNISSRLGTYQCCNPKGKLLGIKLGDDFSESLRQSLLSRKYKIYKEESAFGKHKAVEWFESSKEDTLRIFNLSDLEVGKELWGYRHNWLSLYPEKVKLYLIDYSDYITHNLKDLTDLLKIDKRDLVEVKKFLEKFLISNDRSMYLKNIEFNRLYSSFLPYDIDKLYNSWFRSRDASTISTNELSKGRLRGMEDVIRETIDLIDSTLNKK